MNIIYLDAGHGGLHPVTRRYVTAPSKMFKHSSGVYHDLHLFYEGVFNREFCDILKAKMPANVHVLEVYDEWYDTPLMTRVERANRHWRFHERPKAVFLSIHANAGKGAGWEVFTSPGQTEADVFANLLWLHVQKLGERMRQDQSDGDHDKEAKFTILMNAEMPAVLAENFFFDNPVEAKKLCDSKFLDRLSDCYIDAINEYFIK